MFKHTPTVRRQQPTNCLIVFDHFVGLALKGLEAKFADDSLEKKPKAKFKITKQHLMQRLK